jgi:integrase
MVERSARLKKKDRPRIDPFCMQDAETLIAAIRRDWGDAQGNYDEFRFFTGMRPSEEIALVLSDLDLVNGIISVNKARVPGVDRCQTKTGEDRRPGTHNCYDTTGRAATRGMPPCTPACVTRCTGSTYSPMSPDVINRRAMEQPPPTTSERDNSP